MRHYCTLFDSRYLPQGLVLHESLKKHSSEPFTLYVLPMDEECAVSLAGMVLPNVQMVLGFHGLFAAVTGRSHPGMADARSNRTHQEYCWTCASNFCESVMLIEDLEAITYLDADMMFFSDPKVIFDEIGDRSIAVIPHRLIPSKKHLEVNGKFNVSWVTFKNNPIGRECLSTWAAQCREKCSAKDGCGDQKYLDAWPDKYGPELCVIQNIGAGLAPWNLANYKLTGGPTVDGLPVVFYHAHEFMERSDGTLRLTNYKLRNEDCRLIYEPYVLAYREAKSKLEAISV